jgi:hypothetical protein
VGDTFITVKLRQADFDLCEEHQAFDRVLDSRISRQFSNGFDHSIPRDWCRHDASILALILSVNNDLGATGHNAAKTFDSIAPSGLT